VRGGLALRHIWFVCPHLVDSAATMGHTIAVRVRTILTVAVATKTVKGAIPSVEAALQTAYAFAEP
jgi:hypothetical protein